MFLMGSETVLTRKSIMMTADQGYNISTLKMS